VTLPERPDAGAASTLKVSVVVPVYNPGRFIERCIQSILGQTMPKDEFETIFVDDGSTDGTASRLDELASSSSNVSVVHIPPSGGPGRPRNVGLDRARGEYIQFLDADDELAPSALQRLHATARQNRSDIVIGKFASASVPRRQDLFRRSWSACTLADNPALVDSSFGPTKLFRNGFLREHAISFPESWRQMEDQYFTLKAYLAARVISVLADEPCYFFNRRAAGENISLESIDPQLHVAHLGEILDLVAVKTAPGPLRARLFRRFYQTEIVARLSALRFLASDRTYQARFFGALRDLAVRRFADTAELELAALTRVRSDLLRDDRLDLFLNVVRRSDRLEAQAQLHGARWRAGVLVVAFRARLSDGDGRPFELVEERGRWMLDSLITGQIAAVDVTDEIPAIRAQGSIRDEPTMLEWQLPTWASVELVEQQEGKDGARRAIPTLVGTIEVDPQHVGPGRRALGAGRWELVVRWSGLGMLRTGALRIASAETTAVLHQAEPALLGDPPRYVVAGVDDRGALVLDVDPPSLGLAAALAGRAATVRRDGRHVEALLPMVSGPGAGRATASLSLVNLVNAEGGTTFPARLVARQGNVILVASPGAGRLPAPGAYSLTARLDGDPGPELPLGRALLTAEGLIKLDAVDRLTSLQRLSQAASWTTSVAFERVTSLAWALAVRLPSPVRRDLLKAYQRVRSMARRGR
jgi:glycosyltransferase involved in cell wall biosynthesis